jgi:hypothetical protein
LGRGRGGLDRLADGDDGGDLGPDLDKETSQQQAARN